MAGTGKRKTGGRTAGVPNKSTASAKAAMRAAFDGMGGEDALISWGKDQPTEFYKLWSKLIPSDVNLDADIRTIVRRVDLSGRPPEDAD